MRSSLLVYLAAAATSQLSAGAPLFSGLTTGGSVRTTLANTTFTFSTGFHMDTHGDTHKRLTVTDPSGGLVFDARAQPAILSTIVSNSTLSFDDVVIYLSPNAVRTVARGMLTVNDAEGVQLFTAELTPAVEEPTKFVAVAIAMFANAESVPEAVECKIEQFSR
ncbi:hypothetical protein B0H17DRAFT_1137287 [Mycena rosella]|uniref:Uncharacterized protein n=1 Tax=Mycena rosella TaxID=1033263 RepID=A0AAD7D941_MYCRO|nr:hypothetical protein B0H17DRAFT_1137287 [Mycena rosella]